MKKNVTPVDTWIYISQSFFRFRISDVAEVAFKKVSTTS